MAIDSTGATPIDLKDYQYQSGVKPKSNTSELGKDAFLELLVTQLRYQDPLDPQDNSQFIAQMAQFTSLEQMQNLSQSFSSLQGTSMLGKNITAEIRDPDNPVTAKVVSGIVQSTKVENGKTKLIVNGLMLDDNTVEQVTGVTVDLTEVKEISQTSTAQAGDIWQLNNLIGRLVSAKIPDPDDSSKTKVINGTVTAIKKINNLPALIVGEYVVDPQEIEEIV